MSQREDLALRIASCRRCPHLNVPRVTPSAPCAGVDRPKLMVVGQSLHGYNPRTNPQIPFIGPVESMDSGVLLYTTLKKAGYTLTKGLAVTNVIHCHPPNNRQSWPSEIRNCRPFLIDELDLFQPTIVMTVGGDARDCFQLPRLTSKKKYAMPFRRKLVAVGIHVKYYVIACHPSYVKRYGKKSDERHWTDEVLSALHCVEEWVKDDRTRRG